jgi:hypothetical protein
VVHGERRRDEVEVALGQWVLETAHGQIDRGDLCECRSCTLPWRLMLPSRRFPADSNCAGDRPEARQAGWLLASGQDHQQQLRLHADNLGIQADQQHEIIS